MSVKLEVEFTDEEWSALVEMSQAAKDKTPRDSVYYIVLRAMRIFLCGKTVGMQQMSDALLKK